MASYGVIFVVCIPTEKYEIKLLEKQNAKKEKSNKAKNVTIVEICTPEVLHKQEFKALLELPVKTPSGPRKSLSNDSELNIEDSEKEDSASCNTLHKSKSTEELLQPATPDKTTVRKSWDGFKELISSATKKQPHVLGPDNEDLTYVEKASMEKILLEILKKFNIETASWCEGKNSSFHQVMFSVECARSDAIQQALHDFGIGNVLKSVVSVVPCSMYYNGPQNDSPVSKSSGSEQPSEYEIRTNQQKNSAWNTFVSSVRSRLTVAQVVDRVKAEAMLTFDFVIMLTIAAFVAAIGLVEDSTVFLVSSMLISPLMGPIMAGTFGTVLQDRRLQKLGIINELLGLLLATFIGFLFGLVICSIDDRYGVGEWPTIEMLSKCEIRSLWVGALIALPSGAAVAIAILGENTGSLVGVAISASLLPPAVNAGLLWAMACTFLIWENDSNKYNVLIETQLYSTHQAMELAVLGAISLCLTLVNIFCIYLAAVIVFKIKERAHISTSKERQFWNYDIKIARDYNKTLHGDEARNAGRRLADEIAGFPRGGDVLQNPNADSFTRRDLLSLFRDSDQAQYTWSPMSSRLLGMQAAEPRRPSIQQLDALYKSMTAEPRARASSMRGVRFIDPLKRSSTKSFSPTGLDAPLPTIEENLVNPSSDYTARPRTHRRTPSMSQHFVLSPPQIKLPDTDSEKTPKLPKKFIVTPAVDMLASSKLLGDNKEPLEDNAFT